LSLFSLCCVRITTQLRSVAVDKMAGICTKRIRQPCICQPNQLKREIKKKTGGGQAKIWGAMAHPGPPLESPLWTIPGATNQFPFSVFRTSYLNASYCFDLSLLSIPSCRHNKVAFEESLCCLTGSQTD